MLKAYSKSNLPHVQAFLDEFGPLMIRFEEVFGLPAIALLAQSALETSWGREINKAKDDKGNIRDTKNLFNVQVTKDWQGESGQGIYQELIDGKTILKKEFYRIYNSYEDCLTDYMWIVSSLPRYADAWSNRNDPVKYIDGIEKGGWATGAGYVDAIDSIMKNLIEIRDDNSGQSA